MTDTTMRIQRDRKLLDNQLVDLATHYLVILERPLSSPVSRQRLTTEFVVMTYFNNDLYSWI